MCPLSIKYFKMLGFPRIQSLELNNKNARTHLSFIGKFMCNMFLLIIESIRKFKKSLLNNSFYVKKEWFFICENWFRNDMKNIKESRVIYIYLHLCKIVYNGLMSLKKFKVVLKINICFHKYLKKTKKNGSYTWKSMGVLGIIPLR